MINKQHFGKRVAAHRRRLGLSQAALAERMGVSVQAVSKWENAISLPNVEVLLSLSRLYGVTMNELLEENGLLARIANRPFETRDGIAYFVPPIPEKDTQMRQWEREMREEGWIARNWCDAWGQRGGWAETEYGANVLGERNRICDLRVGRRIAEHGGVILDIGSGPGGGYMPAVLQADENAEIIISDLSHTVVEEWKRLLDQTLNAPQLSYAAFDFCDIPLRDCTIDVVADHSGILNCIGEKAAALREVYRVLKPGGLFVSFGGFVTKETLEALPEKDRMALLKEWPVVLENLYEETVLAGFRKIDGEIMDGWCTDEGDGGFADWAQARGINVMFSDYIRYCEK